MQDLYMPLHAGPLHASTCRTSRKMASLQKELKAAMEDFDHDRSGQLSFEEFLTMMTTSEALAFNQESAKRGPAS